MRDIDGASESDSKSGNHYYESEYERIKRKYLLEEKINQERLEHKVKTNKQKEDELPIVYRSPEFKRKGALAGGEQYGYDNGDNRMAEMQSSLEQI